MKPSDNHYVDNAKFQEAMVEYKGKIRTAKDSGLTKKSDDWPAVSNYIGECFYKIAKHLAFRGNFSGYTYRDEMIGDGIENCLLYADNYDADKYKNPFAYFTQIIFFAFVRRIQREKKHQLIKFKIIDKMDMHEVLTQPHDDRHFVDSLVAYYQEQLSYANSFKQELEKEKIKKEEKAKKAKSKMKGKRLTK